MKKTITRLFFGFLIITILAFSGKKHIAKKTDAEVERIQGMCVFIYSKPTTEYTYLGSVSAPPGGTGASALVNHLIKKGKKRYPSADGIIFTDEKLHKVDLIQFVKN